MKIESFNRLLAIPQLILAGLVVAQLYQNQHLRSDILEQLETFQMKTERSLFSIQSQLESKFNQLRQDQDTNQANNERALRLLNERVRNLEQKPMVIFNGQNGFRTQGQSQQNTNQ